jgi:FixJ family two-component response regulator
MFFVEWKYKAVSDSISTHIIVSIVDDDESVRDALRGFIQSVGYGAEIFASAEDFLGSDILNKTTCLIVDLHMPVMTGLELQRRLCNRQCRIPMIFITAHDDPTARAKALKCGAVDFLRKPFAAEALLNAIQEAVDRRANT